MCVVLHAVVNVVVCVPYVVACVVADAGLMFLPMLMMMFMSPSVS